MRRVLNLFSKHPWLTLLVLFTLSLVAATQLKHLVVKISADELLVIDGEEQLYYQEIQDRFGDERINLLVLEDQDVLAADKLKVLQSIVSEIEALRFVERVDSLFSVPYLRTVDGYLDKEPYLHRLPETSEDSRQLLEQALKNPFLENVLLSSDGQTMALAIVMKKTSTEFDDLEVTRSLDQITSRLDSVYETVFSIGFPYVRIEIADKIQEEQTDLFPYAVLALLVALFILLRQFLDILSPIVTAGGSILWILGFMGYFGIPLNVVTSIVPVLLVIVGSTEDIHLLAEFRRAQREGVGTERAIDQMSRKLGRTVLLTFITTYLGFLSVGLSGIQVLGQFALVAATGLLFNFLITISVIPAGLAIAGKWQLDGRSKLYDQSIWRWTGRYCQVLRARRRFVLWAVFVLAFVAAAGIPRIKINHNAMDSLAQDSAAKGHFLEVNERLAGLESLSIIIDSGIEDTFLHLRYLEELVNIQRFIREQGYSKATTSFADYLSLLNGAFEELDHPEFPDSDDVVSELMIFLNYKHVKAYVSEDYSQARILVRHNMESTEELQGFVDALEGFLATQLDSGLQSHITGDSIQTLTATRAMVEGQLTSIVILLVIIILIISLVFLDIKAGLLAAIPNFFPVIVLFGVMGYTGIPLNIGTTMAAAIAIGVAVDDTLHFMLRYNQQLQSAKSGFDAMHRTIHNEALPMISTSIALIAGFLVFTLSDFQPIVQFGQLSALVIATALLSDFILTPLLISSLRLVTLWDLMSMELRQQVIDKSELFDGMHPWQIRRFFLSSTIFKLKAGDDVFVVGDASNEMYLVVDGKIDVFILTKDKTRLFEEVFTRGDVFGDIALLANSPRRTNARASEDAMLLVLSREDINSSTRLRPIVSAKFFMNLSTLISKRLIYLMENRRNLLDSEVKDA